MPERFNPKRANARLGATLDQLSGAFLTTQRTICGMLVGYVLRELDGARPGPSVEVLVSPDRLLDAQSILSLDGLDESHPPLRLVTSHRLVTIDGHGRLTFPNSYGEVVAATGSSQRPAFHQGGLVVPTPEERRLGSLDACGYGLAEDPNGLVLRSPMARLFARLQALGDALKSNHVDPLIILGDNDPDYLPVVIARAFPAVRRRMRSIIETAKVPHPDWPPSRLLQRTLTAGAPDNPAAFIGGSLTKPRVKSEGAIRRMGTGSFGAALVAYDDLLNECFGLEGRSDALRNADRDALRHLLHLDPVGAGVLGYAFRNGRMVHHRLTADAPDLCVTVAALAPFTSEVPTGAMFR